MKSSHRYSIPAILALTVGLAIILCLKQEQPLPANSKASAANPQVQSALPAPDPSAVPPAMVTKLAPPTGTPLLGLGGGTFQLVWDADRKRRSFTVAEPVIAPLRDVVAEDKFSFPLPDRGFVEATIHASMQDADRPSLWTVGGEIGDHEGSIYLADDAESGLFSGVVMFRNRREAYVYSRSGTGILMVSEVLASEIVCTGEDGLPPLGVVGTSAAAGAAAPVGGSGEIVPLNTGSTGSTVPDCSSRPSATSVLYLDFEAGSITQTFWNCGRTITYASAGMNTNQMVSLWSQVAEDYSSFDVNVTTNRTTYTNASAGRRMRIVMANTTWDSTKTGFAAIGSFPNAGGYWSQRSAVKTNSGFDVNVTNHNGGGTLPANCGTTPIIFPTDIVAWGFGDQFLAPTATTVLGQTMNYARMATHELGHTFGLLHDSLQNTPTTTIEYYAGNGPSTVVDSWRANMGNNYWVLAQWSKGEYANAVNIGWGTTATGAALLQDDLAIIGNGVYGGSGTGLVADDKGDTQATAATLTIDGLGAVNDKGMIHIGTDVDFFRIPIVASNSVINLNITASAPDPNLDVYAELQNSSGTMLASSALLLNRDATIGPITVTSSGNYFLMVRGSTQGTASTGWTRYGNLGNYSINGNVSGSGGAPVITSSSLPPDASVGIAYTFPLSATNNPTSYYYVSGTVPPGLLINSSGLSGTPTTPGWFNFTLAASNAQGGSSKFFTMYVFGPATLVDSLDAPFLPWTTRSLPSSTVPSTLWQGQQAINFDGGDAARSGTSGANSESWLETTVAGPGKLTFYWRTSSAVGDRLSFRMDVTDQFFIEGETGWAERTVNIPSGNHPIAFIYRTDAGTTAGQNAGFVDKVIYLQTPDFPNGNFFAGGTVGQPFSWPVEALSAEAITNWAVTGGALPPGITLDPVTGFLSGTPTTTGSYDPQITATNRAGSSTTYPNITIYPAITLPVALDAAGLTWLTGGANSWFGDTATNHDGVDAAHSGLVSHGRNSWLQTTVTGPGNFSFWWKASTEPTGDPASFSIDGVPQTSISGEINWAQRTYALGAGAHTLRWEYTRDGSGNGGQNTVWLDQISWTTPGPSITSPLLVNWTCGQQYSVSLTSDDPNATWTMSGAIDPDMFFLGTSKIIGAFPRHPRTTSFTIIATNTSGVSTSREFIMNIESSYAAWARTKGLAVGTEMGDPDKDGIPNIMELAFALDPLVKDTFRPITFDAATKRLRAVFKRRHQSYPDLKYEVQASSDLQNWTDLAYVDDGSTVTNVAAQSITQTTVTPFPDAVNEVTVIDGTPQSAANAKRSLRLKITQQ